MSGSIEGVSLPREVVFELFEDISTKRSKKLSVGADEAKTPSFLASSGEYILSLPLTLKGIHGLGLDLGSFERLCLRPIPESKWLKSPVGKEEGLLSIFAMILYIKLCLFFYFENGLYLTVFSMKSQIYCHYNK
ncbi:hypothetical protein DID80_00465 [Candidatus Marinamargulisbacteria bacterium SCGC AAA071-K20]|nr:hypothetical protein DID80_00465 [Candidatus Marinamargulisbacteria bacterium SCGC AAA071-K20]